MATQTKAVRIWDLPVRLTHWSFVILLPAMWRTAENSQWGWHIRLGHARLALLIFRIITLFRRCLVGSGMGQLKDALNFKLKLKLKINLNCR